MKNALTMKDNAARTPIPSDYIMSSMDIADSLGLGHGDIAPDIELMMCEEGYKGNGYIQEVKIEHNGGYFTVFLLGLEGVLAFLNNLEEEIRQPVLTRFFELASNGTRVSKPCISMPQYELSFEAMLEVLEDYTLEQQIMVLEAFRQLVCTKKLRVSEQVKINFPRTYLYYLIDIIERELEIAGYSPSI